MYLFQRSVQCCVLKMRPSLDLFIERDTFSAKILSSLQNQGKAEPIGLQRKRIQGQLSGLQELMENPSRTLEKRISPQKEGYGDNQLPSLSPCNPALLTSFGSELGQVEHPFDNQVDMLVTKEAKGDMVSPNQTDSKFLHLLYFVVLNMTVIQYFDAGPCYVAQASLEF